MAEGLLPQCKRMGGPAEGGEDPDPGGGTICFGPWTGPKRVFAQVRLWGTEKCDEKSIGTFFQYTLAFAESMVEEDEVIVWMLKQVTYYLEEYGGWSAWDKTVGSWDWSKLALSYQWAIPLPEWSTERERMDIEQEDKLKEESVLKGESLLKEESVMKKECVLKEESVMKKESVLKEDVKGDGCGKAESLDVEERNGIGEGNRAVAEKEREEGDVKEGDEDVRHEVKEKEIDEGRKEGLGKGVELMIGGMELPCWGTQLPPPTPSPPPSAAPWRPWEKQEEKEAKSPKEWERKGRRKKRSPAAAARSRQRLLKWQEKVDCLGQHRLQVEQRITPQRGSSKVERTRLVARLEEYAPVESPGVSGDGTSGRGETGRRPCLRGDSLTVPASGSKTYFSLQQSYVTPEVYSIPPTPPPSAGWVNVWPPARGGGSQLAGVLPLAAGCSSPSPELWNPPLGALMRCTSCWAWGPLTPV